MKLNICNLICEKVNDIQVRMKTLIKSTYANFFTSRAISKFFPRQTNAYKIQYQPFSQKVHLLQRLLPFGIFNCLNNLCRENLLKLLFSLK